MNRIWFAGSGWLAGLLLAVLAVAGCVDQDTGGTTKAGGRAPALEGPSVFAGTSFEVTAPQALAMNRDMTRVYVKAKGPGLPESLFLSYGLEPGLAGPVEFLSTALAMRAFVSAHPSADECLLISHEQAGPGEPIRDVIWRYLPENHLQVDYMRARGLPDDLPVDACYNLEPFYSGDGNYIIVPLHAGGLCIMRLADRDWSYVPYLEEPGVPTGQLNAPVPDIDGVPHIYVSRWEIAPEGEWCQVGLLNLATGEWVQNFQIHDPENPDRQWVIYEIAGENLAAEPWLVRGSRLPNKNTEKTRVPRLALVDPLTGHVELLMFHGEPIWPMALDSRGRYLVYLDRHREAIVRLDIKSHQLDYDARWCAGDGNVMVAPGGSPVYVWRGTELIRADFTEHEEFEE